MFAGLFKITLGLVGLIKRRGYLNVWRCLLFILSRVLWEDILANERNVQVKRVATLKGRIFERREGRAVART